MPSVFHICSWSASEENRAPLRGSGRRSISLPDRPPCLLFPAPRPGCHDRGERQGCAARGAPGASRGGRKLQGRQGFRREGTQPRRRDRGAAKPRPRAAGDQDRP